VAVTVPAPVTEAVAVTVTAFAVVPAPTADAPADCWTDAVVVPAPVAEDPAPCVTAAVTDPAPVTEAVPLMTVVAVTIGLARKGWIGKLRPKRATGHRLSLAGPGHSSQQM
jgi:hypothetical protein